MFSSRSAIIAATVAAVALTSFDLSPAAAASGPVIVKQKVLVKQKVADEFGAARKRRRGGGAFPLAAFGAIVGTIATIAATERRREYYAPYGGPVEGVYAAPYGYEPQVYAPQAEEQVYPDQVYQDPVYETPGAYYAPRAYYGGHRYAPRVQHGRAFAPVPRTIARQAFHQPQGAAPRIGGVAARIGGAPRIGGGQARVRGQH